jgi:hypothetical protein
VYSYNFFITGWVNRFANAGDTAMEVAGNTALRVSYDFKILFLCVALHYFLQLSHWNLDFLVLLALNTSNYIAISYVIYGA